MNKFSDMIGDEFAQEKLGELVDDEPSMGRIFSLGLIHDDGENTPEETAETITTMKDAVEQRRPP